MSTAYTGRARDQGRWTHHSECPFPARRPAPGILFLLQHPAPAFWCFDTFQIDALHLFVYCLLPKYLAACLIPYNNTFPTFNPYICQTIRSATKIPAPHFTQMRESGNLTLWAVRTLGKTRQGKPLFWKRAPTLILFSHEKKEKQFSALYKLQSAATGYIFLDMLRYYWGKGPPPPRAESIYGYIWQ